jgi:site-specific recombinase XerD
VRGKYPHRKKKICRQGADAGGFAQSINKQIVYRIFYFIKQIFIITEHFPVKLRIIQTESVLKRKRMSIRKSTLERIGEVNIAPFNAFIQLLKLKAYSPATQRTYISEFVQLLYTLKGTDINSLTLERLKKYFEYCIDNQKLTEAQMNSRINAVKFYFEKVLGREKMMRHFPRPKEYLRLPKYLNKQDVKKLFEVTGNLKHNSILKMCYGMGLRLSEVVNLNIKDIDSRNMQVLLVGAKGKKDRYVNLPESILGQLRVYYKEYKPRKYLFEGQNGERYSERSVQRIFKEAMKKAGINKDVGIHSLRHSFATHLLQEGTDVSLIQRLLGHNDIKTTMIYAKVGTANLKNIKSPLDSL